MTLTPKEITRDARKGISITWSNNSRSQLSCETLRRNCPCAACKEKRGDTSHSTPLTPRRRSLTVIQNTIDEELNLVSIWGVGQYAIGIRWGDGHDSGIYTFSLLLELQARD